MKAFITSILIAMVTMLMSFSQKSNIDEVIGALQSGNASEMSKYFDDNLELTLPSKSDSYSKAQATLILKDFFSNNGVKKFEIKHKSEQGGGQFCIGTLQTQSGNFRTTIFMKMKSSKEVVKEIRFQAME
jgi:hypothetical protein